MKIDVCRGEDLQTLYPSEADEENVMDDTKLIKTNLTEPDVELFMNVTSHRSFVNLMKSSTFGLGLSLLYPF